MWNAIRSATRSFTGSHRWDTAKAMALLERKRKGTTVRSEMGRPCHAAWRALRRWDGGQSVHHACGARQHPHMQDYISARTCIVRGKARRTVECVTPMLRMMAVRMWTHDAPTQHGRGNCRRFVAWEWRFGRLDVCEEKQMLPRDEFLLSLT